MQALDACYEHIHDPWDLKVLIDSMYDRKEAEVMLHLVKHALDCIDDFAVSFPILGERLVFLSFLFSPLLLLFSLLHLLSSLLLLFSSVSAFNRRLNCFCRRL